MPIANQQCGATLTGRSPMAFQYERLVVHSKALEYSVLVQPIIEKIRLHDRDMASQLQRSSNSVPTNIAEGASEDRPKIKADRYRTAKREAEESASDLEKACRLGWVTREEIAQCMFLLDEIARMLYSLIKRFDGGRA